MDIENVLINSLGLKKSEKLLLITDDELYDLAEIFYSQAKKLGFEPVLVKYRSRKIHGQEPPVLVESALKNCDVALLITSKSLSHTKARKRATQKGVRIASLPGISYQIAMRTLGFDYTKIKRKIEKIANKLTEANQIRVKTESGTDISFFVKGRKGFADTGIYREKSAFGNLPAGEACIAPLENTANGVIIIDASVAGFGKLTYPIFAKIEKGFLVYSRPKDFEKKLAGFGRKAKSLAEFGIGLNPSAKVTGDVLEDEKVKGTCHFAFGSNISFGGRINAGIHIDAVLYNPQIYLDGKRLKL